MISKTTASFWICFGRLSADLQTLARLKFQLWRRDPFHPSLHFKLLTKDVWSARVTRNYRALARRKGELIVWFWIGTHEQYDRLVHSAG